ncbi:hypothetical protein BaRGS_00007790 [Batillaria attramentaria]|uniref:Uncharacterized protein n=1 Tax=Batillaria attramentaria TaxID=370345 RepID=A0ABD0LNZ8_9CAEN
MDRCDKRSQASPANKTPGRLARGWRSVLYTCSSGLDPNHEVCESLSTCRQICRQIRAGDSRRRKTRTEKKATNNKLEQKKVTSHKLEQKKSPAIY